MNKENVLEYLKNLKVNYLSKKKGDRFLPPMYKAKCIGAMEALLIVLDELNKYEVFQYNKITIHSKFLFCEFTRTRKETHEELILRLVDETLEKLA